VAAAEAPRCLAGLYRGAVVRGLEQAAADALLYQLATAKAELVIGTSGDRKATAG